MSIECLPRAALARPKTPVSVLLDRPDPQPTTCCTNIYALHQSDKGVSSLRSREASITNGDTFW